MKYLTGLTTDLTTKIKNGVGKATNTTQTSPLLQNMANTFNKKVSGRLTIPNINTTRLTDPLKQGLTQGFTKGLEQFDRAKETMKQRTKSVTNKVSRYAQNKKTLILFI